MNGTRCKVHEERFVRIEGFTGSNPLNGFVSQILSQVVLGVVWRFNWVGVFKQYGFILWCFSCQKTIKVVKSHSCWIAVEGTKFCNVSDWCVMPFSKCSGVITVIRKYLRKGGRWFGDLAHIAIPVGSKLGNLTRTHSMMVTPCQQWCPRRRTHGCGVKRIVADTWFSQSIHRRHMNGTPKCLRVGKACIIGHKNDDIGGILW